MRAGWMTLLALALCVQVAFGQVPPAAALQEDAGAPVIEFEKQPIARADFERWLVMMHGEPHARGFARSWLLHREAVQKNVVPSKEEVSARVEALIEVRVQNAFRGDRDAWRAELAATGTDEASYRADRHFLVAQELELEELARARRTYPEAEVREEFERIFGRGGRTLQLRWIALDIDYGVRAAGRTREEVNQLRDQVEAAALERGAALRARLTSGEDFAAVAKQLSDDEATRSAGGLLAPGLDFERLPADLVTELYALKLGEITRPAIVRGRLVLLKLESVTRTAFEEGRARALADLQARPISTDESDPILRELEASAPHRVLPAMSAPTGVAEELVLSIGEASIRFPEFAAWLRHRIGHSTAEQFLRVHLVQQFATTFGIRASEDEIAARVQELVTLGAEQFFRGDEEAWEADLISQGKSRSMFERQASHRARTALLAEKAILRKKVISDLELRGAWTKRYGQDGRTQEARVLLRVVREPDLPPGTSPEEAKRLRDQAKEETRIELEKLKTRIEDGEDFAALAKRYSDDELTRENGGELGLPFRKRNWPEPFLEAVEALKVGQLTAPLYYTGAWFLFEVTADERVPFEAVREELRIELMNARPPAIEVAVFLESMLRDRDWRVLPGMYE